MSRSAKSVPPRPGGLPQGVREVALRKPAGEAAAHVVVAGDLSIPAGTAMPADGQHPWRSLRQAIAGHDVSIVNLECPLTAGSLGIAKVGPSLAGDARLAAVARDGGFTVASLANNHIMDRGPDGLDDTLVACAGAGLLTVGAGAGLAEAREPLLVTASGLRIAVVAVAEHEFSIASRNTPGAAPLDPWSTPLLVRDLRSQGLVVLVLVHGGNELYPLPRPGLVAACRALAAAGAGAVICHHSHVAGPWEVYRGVPITYGTGNFLFPSRKPRPSAWRRGYLVSLTIDREGASTLRLVACEQDADVPLVHPLDTGAASVWFGHLDDMAATLADPAALGEAWRRFCRTRRPYVLASLLGLGRVERRLLRAGVWPSWRVPSGRIPELYDMITCESQREVLETLLEEDMGP